MTATIVHFRSRFADIEGWFTALPLLLQGPLITLLSMSGLAVASALLTPLLFYNAHSSLCRPEAGLALAALLLCRRRVWPWIVAGFLVVLLRQEIAAGVTLPSSILGCTGSLFEVMLPALCLPHFTNLSDWLRKPYLIHRFCLFALALGPSLGAGLSAIVSTGHPAMLPWPIILRSTTSESLGIVLFTPLLLVLASPETRQILSSGVRWRNTSIILLMLLTGWFVFRQSTYPLEFLLFPLLVVIVTVVGFSAAVFCVTGLTLLAAAATLHGAGPFLAMQGGQEPSRVLLLQIFLIAATMMSFALTLIPLERRAFEDQLNGALHKMELLATHDSLTGLGNRRLFEKSLEAEWARALRQKRTIALLLLDADCFKLYNDFYGHVAGDTCLCLIAKSLKTVVRRPGDLAARYGGEEFVILLPGSDLDDAKRIAESIRRDVVALNVLHRGNPYSVVTVSVGCSATSPTRNQRPLDLLKAADLALYAAKHEGRNRIAVRFCEAPPL